MTSSSSSPDRAQSARSQSGHPSPMPVVLTIAGSDSSGGAGIQADLKTISALGGYGCVAITAVTAQNTRGVDAAEYMSPGFVAQQIRSVADDYPIDAIKIGMVGSSSIADAIVTELKGVSFAGPVVWDPVMVTSSGSSLVDDETTATSGFVDLARRADALTPNGRELVGLCDMAGVAVPATLRKHLDAIDSQGSDSGNPSVSAAGGSHSEENVGNDEETMVDVESLTSAIAEAASALSEALGTVIVVTGGPDNGFGDDGPKVTEVVADREQTALLSHDRVATTNTHGTGCTFSSALATFAARRVHHADTSSDSGTHLDVSACDWRATVHDAAAWTRRALVAADVLDFAIGLHRNRDSSGTAKPAHVNGNAPLDHFWEHR
ncbi:bifunctional hydroxymethylpyrimidine kinase/phosphomethylpyrimidine kinase [Corynebacterium parakroppenstedtii]|uniref:bifunctional hydroxymethylpyrimidine kinase/phosphomethylpyrimidine kinase n=1 Tax=Corynebacterium parakroppenstedtii TaxID=2828363 RepID=UPI001C8DADF5|nr:hydroxymethylpyrimidine/phosphomethylpyrimidine kinase [Corynebacterium parakroppenstedtii]MBY0788342.1 hydroxymethylpyrimidine/phosphomethylpyrimidine kinase [Corynebacterium parakroppenstedtii]